jgi:hypothetical protein
MRLIVSGFCFIDFFDSVGDLFENKSLFAKGNRLMANALGGVENVYTQHKPILIKIMDQVIITPAILITITTLFR